MCTLLPVPFGIDLRYIAFTKLRQTEEALNWLVNSVSLGLNGCRILGGE